MNASVEQADELRALAESILPPQPEETIDLDSVRIPHITIDVFRETDMFTDVWEHTIDDRRMMNATTNIFDGGFPAAVKHYTTTNTPDLIIIETDADEVVLEIETDLLAEVCDPNTRLIVVGHKNDIHLYQKLLNLGVSNYLVFPVTITSIITAISEIYREPGNDKIGKITAVIGAKGGVGASTVAQNIALQIAGQAPTDVLLIDLDLVFGTSAFNLDIEPNQGLRELIDQGENVDSAMLDRVLIKRGLNFNLLGCLPSLESDRVLSETSIDAILDVAATHVPHIILDMPHNWSPATRHALKLADRVLVVSTPELGCLRNTAAMFQQLGNMRPNDELPQLVLNQVGLPRRQEISAKEIESILKIKPAAAIPYDAKSFGRADAAGKMVCEVASGKPAARAMAEIAQKICPSAQRKVPRKTARGA